MQTKRQRWERGKARLADAPCRPRTSAREGRGGGLGLPSPGQSPLTHPRFPLCQLPKAGVKTRWRAPRICLRSGDPTPSSSQGKEHGQPGGWRGAGPGFAPHTCTPGGGSRRSRAGPGGRALARGLVLSASPPPEQNGRAGGRAREIRSHNIGYGPSPPLTFRRGGGNRSSSQAWQRFGPRAGQPKGLPLSLAPSSPSGSRRSGQWSCRHCLP